MPGILNIVHRHVCFLVILKLFDKAHSYVLARVRVPDCGYLYEVLVRGRPKELHGVGLEVSEAHLPPDGISKNRFFSVGLVLEEA